MDAIRLAHTDLNVPHIRTESPPPPPPPNGLPPGLDGPVSVPAAAPAGYSERDSAANRRTSVTSTATARAGSLTNEDRVSVDYFPAALQRRISGAAEPGRVSRRPSGAVEPARGSSRRPSHASVRGGTPAMCDNDRFEHYRRPPGSRDGSVERAGRRSASRARRTPLPAELSSPVSPVGSVAPSPLPGAASPEPAGWGAPEAADRPRFFIPETPEQAAELAQQMTAGGPGMKRTESMFMPGPQGRRGGTVSSEGRGGGVIKKS